MTMLERPPKSRTAVALERKVFDLPAIEKKAGAGDRVRRFVITSDALDRDNECVMPGGMQTDEWAANPQFLWAHKADIPPVGKGLPETLEQLNGGRLLVCSFEFASTKFADEIFELYRGGFLRAVSVGFKALVAGPPHGELIARRPELQRCWRVVTASKLYEVSAVPIPSNPDALETAIRTKSLNLSPEVMGALMPHVQPESLVTRTLHWLGKTLGWSRERVESLTLKEVSALEHAVNGNVDDEKCPHCNGAKCERCNMMGLKPRMERKDDTDEEDTGDDKAHGDAKPTKPVTAPADQRPRDNQGNPTRQESEPDNDQSIEDAAVGVEPTRAKPKDREGKSSSPAPVPVRTRSLDEVTSKAIAAQLSNPAFRAELSDALAKGLAGAAARPTEPAPAPPRIDRAVRRTTTSDYY